MQSAFSRSSTSHLAPHISRRPVALPAPRGWPTLFLQRKAAPFQRAPFIHAAPLLSPSVTELVTQWLELDKDQSTRVVITDLAAQGEEQQLLALLGKRLQFGTAGLRGRMGPGFNAMNSVVIQQTTQGLCTYLLSSKESNQKLRSNGVAIGYDGRYNSRHFAELATAVFVSKGIHVHLFSTIVPTPFVAAAVAELNCAAGIMITASHNPKQDNGYKVYWGNGCQIIPPHDEGIAHAILANCRQALWELPHQPGSGADIYDLPLASDPLSRVTQAYYGKLAEGVVSRSKELNATADVVVYTPLHGVGLQPLLQAFQVAGLPLPHVVPLQAQPDPEFPTVTFPNPEEGKGTWKLAFEEGALRGAALVIANDPDADRLAIAEWSDLDASAVRSGGGGEYLPFTGNEIGALLASWIWRNHQQQHPEVPPSKCVMLASTVSSSFLAGMAKKEGFHFEQTLTGFKWLGNRALQLEEQGYKVLFAFEEAIGFMLGSMYKDKDGISAAVAICELTAQVYSQQSTLRATLAHLYKEYGSSAYRSGYYISSSPAETAGVFQRLREGGQYAQSISGLSVSSVRDMGTGLDTLQPDSKATLPWKEGDMMITYRLEEGATVTVRASGTEPKVKYYMEVIGDDQDEADALASRLEAGVLKELFQR